MLVGTSRCPACGIRGRRQRAVPTPENFYCVSGRLLSLSA